MVEISILIVNYNGIKFLPALFQSISLQSFQDFEVVILDNNSSDQSVHWIKTQKIIASYQLIESAVNLGFAEGNNLCFQKSKGKFITLLNYDTVVDLDWLKHLHATIQKYDADVAGPKILFYYPYLTFKILINEDFVLSISLPHIEDLLTKKTLINNQIANLRLDESNKYKLHHGDNISVPIDLGTSSNYEINWQIDSSVQLEIQDHRLFFDAYNHKHSIDSELIKQGTMYLVNSTALTTETKNGRSRDVNIYKIDEGFDSEIKVEGFSGCCFMVRRSIVEIHGLFDSRYFMYCEDADFFWRLRNREIDNFIFTPRSKVYHYQSVSKEKNPWPYRLLLERNRWLTLIKNGKWKDIMIQLVIYVAFLVKIFIQGFYKNNWKEIGMYIEALVQVPFVLLKTAKYGIEKK